MSTHIINFPGADIHTTTITSVSNVSVGENLDVHGTANVAALTATLPYSTASANIVAWNSSTNEVIDSGIERGFTEHPVEPMTDYTTYVEGHGTYEASVSSYDSTYSLYPWEAFDNDISTRWTISTSDDNYNASTGEWDQTAIDASPNVFTSDVGGTRYHGHWLQIKLPYAVTLSHSNIYPQTTARAPKDGVILGSNDGEHWYKLTEFSGETYSASTWTRIDVNATTPYQYFRMCTTKNGGNSKLELIEWRLFAEKPMTRMENVHISGDLSSETLQTGYIKWPRVPLKANESEGYVVTASNVYNTNISTQPFAAFNDIREYLSNGYGPSFVGGNGDFTSGVANKSRTTGDDTFNHEWLQIQLPNSIALSHFTMMQRLKTSDSDSDMPTNGRVYASNDGISWTKLTSFSGLRYSRYQFTKVDVRSNERYSFYRFAFTQLVGAYNFVTVGELQLFEAATGVGGAPTSAKLQVHGSLGMAKGSDLYAGDDVVMELPKHDRPLTKYPEVLASATNVTTTGLVQTWAGYTSNVSSSGVNDGGRLAYDGLFNTVNPWISASGTYETTGGTATSSDSFESTSGSFLKLTLPNKIRLSHVCIYNRDSASTKAPKNGIIWGSDDGGTTFSQIRTFSNLDPTRAMKHTLHITSTNKYDTIVVQITAMQVPGSGTYDQVAIQELELYGTEEGDTSVDVVHRSVPNKPGTQQLAVYWDANDSNSYSFADSSNVYDLSGNGRTGTMTGGVGFDAEYNAFTFDGGNITGDSNSTAGNWIHTMSTWIYFNSLVTNEVFRVTPNSFVYGGHNEVSAFFARSSGFIWDFGMQNNNTTTLKPVTNRWYHVTLVADGSGYKKIYIDNELQTSFSYSNNTNIVMQTNAPLAIGVGNLDGSIANARLYSKALNPDQVRELYEYDAERFGHRQNLVALHKGNLGVGVAHPTARFEVAGADGLQEYPPKAMTGFETYMEGHGVFRVHKTADDTYLFNSWPVWEAFNEVFTDAYHGGNFYTGTDHAYAGTGSLGGISGDYVILEMPYKIKAKSISLAPYTVLRMCEDFTILGSNDNVNWSELATFNGITNWTAQVYSNFAINSDEYFSHFAVVIGRLVQDTYLMISEIKYFGTPAPSSLEDGHLTLGKALTLPRVSGHAAGAETPRADSLVVHYDTTVDSVVSGDTVVDISGNGLNGTLNNNTTYSSSDRALVFDGTDDYIKVNDTGVSGDYVHSISFWIYNNNHAANPFWIGENIDGKRINIYLPTTGIDYSFRGDAVSTTSTPPINRWWHLTVTYNGTQGINGRKIYIDGVAQTTVHTGTPAALNITDGVMYLGTNFQQASDLNGKMSKIKIWNVALTADEVAAEYALGRTGKALNITDTAVCLGGTAPRAQLDVRGSALFDGDITCMGVKDKDFILGMWTTTLDASASTTIIKNLGSGVSTPSAPGSGMSGNVGEFTAPVAGYYYTICQVKKATRTSSNLLIVYDASGTNFATNNPYIGTYSEIIDLRTAENIEQCYNWAYVLHMESGDSIRYRIHSSVLTDSASFSMDCSVHLLNRI